MAERQVTLTVLLKDRLTKGLTRASRAVGGIRGDFEQLANRIGPLAGRVTALAGAFAGFETVRRSLQFAEEELTIQRRLLTALDNRVDLFQTLNDEANRLQSITTEGNETFLEVATILATAGVNAREIPQAMLTAVDVATQLGISVESVVKSVAKFRGNLAGELGEVIPELAALREEGRLASDGLDFLTEKFGGASEAIRATDFGRARGALNDLQTPLKDVGNALASVQASIIEGLQPAFDLLAQAVTSPAFRGFVRVLEGVLSNSGRILVAVTGIVAAVGAIKLAVFLGPLVLIAAKIGVIVTAVTLVGRKLLELTGIIEPLRALFSSLGNQVGDLFSGIGEGRNDIDDLVDFLRVKLEQVKVFLRAIVVDPIRIAIEDVTTQVTARYRILIARAKEAAELVRFQFTRGGSQAELESAQRINALGVEIIQAEAAIRKAGDTRSRIAENYADALAEIDQLERSFQRRLEQDRRAFSERQKQERISEAEAEAEARFQALGEIVRLGQEDLEQSVLRSAVLQSIGEESLDPSQVSAFLDEIPRQFQEAARDAILATLKRQLEAEKITRAEFLDVQTALSEEALKNEIAAREEAIGKIREQIIAAQARNANELELLDLFRAQRDEQGFLFAAELELAKARKESGEQRAAAANELVDLAGTAIEELREFASIEFEDLRTGLKGVGEAQEEVSAKTDETVAKLETFKATIRDLVADGSFAEEDADRLIAKIDELRGGLEEEISIGFAVRIVAEFEAAAQAVAGLDAAVTGAIQQGFIPEGDIERLAAQRESLVEFRGEVLELLDGLIERSPEAAEQLEILRERVGDFSREAGLADAQEGLTDFFEGIAAGFQTVAQGFESIRALGVRLGQFLGNFAAQLGNALVDSVLQADFSWREFVANFLAGLAKMIAQALIMQAILAALGAFGIGFPVVAAGAQTAAGVATAMLGGSIGARGRYGAGTGTYGDLARILKGTGAVLVDGVPRPVPAGFGDRGVISRAAGGPTSSSSWKVPGVDTGRDSVAALLRPKEWVITVASSGYYTDRGMDAINRRLVPREVVLAYARGVAPPVVPKVAYNAGGAVAAADRTPGNLVGSEPQTPRPRALGVQRSVVVNGEQEFDRMLAGGSRPMLRWFQRHGGEINSILGRSSGR